MCFRELYRPFSVLAVGNSGVGIKMTDSLKLNGSNYSELSFMFSCKLFNDRINSFREQRPRYPIEKYIPWKINILKNNFTDSKELALNVNDMCLTPKSKPGNPFPYTAFPAEGHRLFH